MQRQALMFLAAALGFSAAYAQDGALAGVTMRVLDDVSGLDAVIIELDANEDKEAAEAERPEVDAAAEADRVADGRDAAAQEDSDVERPAAPPTPVP
jgi:hypothetical protein